MDNDTTAATDDHVGRVDADDEAYAAEAWRDVGAHLTEQRVHDVRWGLAEALHAIAERIRAGEALTREDVDDVRRATDDLHHLTEEHLARLAPGVEPWDRGVSMVVPYGVMRRHLEDDDFPPRRVYGDRDEEAGDQ